MEEELGDGTMVWETEGLINELSEEKEGREKRWGLMVMDFTRVKTDTDERITTRGE